MPIPGSLGGQQGLPFPDGLEGSAGLLEQRFVPGEKMLHSDLCSAAPLRALPERAAAPPRRPAVKTLSIRSRCFDFLYGTSQQHTTFCLFI